MWEFFNIFEPGNHAYLFLTAPVVLSQTQKEIIVGVILGDAYVIRVKPTHNARVRFDQSYPEHEKYLIHLYDNFSNLTLSEPKVIPRKPDKRTGKVYSTIRFTTRNLSCLNTFHDLFYKTGVKQVPNNISEILTAQGLAYWIIDDGHKTSSNQTVLNTNSYTLKEVQLLQAALGHNFQLRTRLIEKIPGVWLICIPVRQATPVNQIVGKYITNDIKYKIKLLLKLWTLLTLWEGIGVLSFLLINFWTTRIQASKAAIQAITVNRIGDMFLSIGFFVCLWTFTNVDYVTSFSLAAYTNESIMTIIGILFLIGASAKSAQIGLHVWLVNAMEGCFKNRQQVIFILCSWFVHMLFLWYLISV